MKKRWLLAVALLIASVSIWHSASRAQEAPRPVLALELQQMAHAGPVAGGTWTDDESRLITWSHDGTIAIWQSTSLTEPALTLTVGGWVEGVRWSADETRLLAWSNAPYACITDCAYAVRVWQQLDTAPLVFPHPARIFSAEWNHNATLILTAAADGQVRIWEVASRALVAAFQHASAATGAIWRSDEQAILSWSVDATARLWDSMTGVELLRLQHTGWVNGARFNAAEDRILTWARDNSAVLWDAVTGELMLKLGHGSWVTSAMLNGDETRILTGSADGTIRMWDARSGAIRLEVSLPGAVLSAAWNADETQIFARSLARHGWISVWDAADGRLVTTLPQPAFVRGVQWNTNSTRVLTWSDDGLARLWIIPQPGDCIITTSHNNVNQREAPTTRSAIVGRMTSGDVNLAIGQSLDAQSFRWWQLADASWVREDVVIAQGQCDTLPVIE